MLAGLFFSHHGSDAVILPALTCSLQSRYPRSSKRRLRRQQDCTVNKQPCCAAASSGSARYLVVEGRPLERVLRTSSFKSGLLDVTREAEALRG